MSGHSKWSKIKHKKGAADASRGKLFGKLAKEIFVAAKNGDPDPANNANLRLAIEKAKAQSMPKDNIDRAIKRASGSGNTDNYEEIVYEGYAANGVAVLVYCLTDNRNRTASFVKSTFPRRGGNLGSDGSVSYLFSRKGVILIATEDLTIDTEEFMMTVLDFNIEDINESDGIVEIYTDPKVVFEIKKQIDELNVVNDYIKAESEMVSQTKVELDEEQAQKVLSLIDELEDNDDVQSVFHNLK